MGPINGPPTLTMPMLDASVLSAYYSSGAALGPQALAAKLKNEGLIPTRDAAAVVVPPWLQSDPTANDENALNRIFSSGSLIDPEDPLVKRNGGDENFEKLFALYRGLSRLRELTDYAENGRQADLMRGLLDRRFQSYLAEIDDYVSGLELPGVTLIGGIKQSSLESSLFTPKPLEKTQPTHLGAVVSTVREDPIAGLTGAERFTINVETSTGTTAVEIDLSQVSGPLNLDNIAGYINDQLAANDVLTRFAVERYHETAYGLRINGVVSENLSFAADPATQSGAVYLVGSSGGGDYADGFLRKLDDLDAASPNTAFVSPVNSGAADGADAVAVDSKGNVYVVGTTDGDLDAEINQGTPDAYLRKYDAAGNLIWSRLLGSATEASGFAVAVDPDDNVVIAGQTRDMLSPTAYGGNYDSFVTKYDSDGRELWTSQASPYANDGALALTVDADGNVFVAGQAREAIAVGLTHGGGGDGYVRKLGADGTILWNKQFGGAGEDRATAVAVDGAGNVYVAGEADGHAILRKYADDDVTQAPVWETDLGALGADGAVTGLALGSGGALYVTGSTTNAALAGSIAQAHSGGRDGFVTRIVDNGASAGIGFTSYLGSTGSDEVTGITVGSDGGADVIFLTGSTTGSIAGQTQHGEIDGFTLKLDQSGATVWAEQFGGGPGQRGTAIAFDADGTSVISRLGLPAGPTLPAGIDDMTALTSTRPGMYFRIAVNGGAAERVTIEDGDGYGMLAFRINRVLGKYGVAKLEDEPEGRRLVIEARNGGRIEILPGKEGHDALAPLGLTEATLFADAEESGDGEEDAKETVFSLGLIKDLSVADGRQAADAGIILDNAMREVRDVYNALSGEDAKDPLAGVAISAADQARINALSFALERVSQLTQSLPTSFSVDA